MDFHQHIEIGKELYVRQERTNTSIPYTFPEQNRLLKCFFYPQDNFFFNNFKEAKAAINSTPIFPKVYKRVSSTPYGNYNYVMEFLDDWRTLWGAIQVEDRLKWVYFLIRELKELWDRGYIYESFNADNLVFKHDQVIRLLAPDHINLVPVNAKFEEIYKWGWIVRNESSILYDLHESSEAP